MPLTIRNASNIAISENKIGDNASIIFASQIMCAPSAFSFRWHRPKAR